jgi:hypothetical protein
MKAKNRAMIRIRAIPYCQVSKQGIRREGNAITGIGGWKYDPCGSTRLLEFLDPVDDADVDSQCDDWGKPGIGGPFARVGTITKASLASNAP